MQVLVHNLKALHNVSKANVTSAVQSVRHLGAADLSQFLGGSIES